MWESQDWWAIAYRNQNFRTRTPAVGLTKFDSPQVGLCGHYSNFLRPDLVPKGWGNSWLSASLVGVCPVVSGEFMLAGARRA